MGYYLIWLALLVGEDYLTRLLQFLAHKMASATFTIWIVMILFFVGAVMLCLGYYLVTKRGERFDDPFLRWTSAWLGRGWLRFIVASLIPGPTAVACILKADGYQTWMRTILQSSMFFVIVWVPIFSYVQLPT